MKFLDYFSMSINNIKGNKKAFFRNSILIGISLSILMLSSIATKSINNVLEKNIKNNLSFRSIYVRNNSNSDQKNFINKIEEIDHVIKAVTQEEYYTYVDVYSVDNKQLAGGISLLGSNKDIFPQIIAGRKMEENEKNVCIIPKKFQPQTSDNSKENNEIIDGEELLDKEIEIVYYNYDYSKEYRQPINTIKEKYKVIGVYDQDVNMGEYYDCYVNFEDVLKIHTETEKGSNYNNDNKFESILAIVDNSENVNEVLDLLESQGYEAFLRSTPNENLVILIKSVCTIISICIMVIALSSIIINIIRNAEDRKYELGLLKSFGYNNRNLWMVVIFESVIIAITSFILSCIIVLGVVLILHSVLQSTNGELKRLDFIIDYKAFLYSFLISLIISMFGNVVASYNIIHKATVIKNIKK